MIARRTISPCAYPLQPCLHPTEDRTCRGLNEAAGALITRLAVIETPLGTSCPACLENFKQYMLSDGRIVTECIQVEFISAGEQHYFYIALRGIEGDPLPESLWTAEQESNPEVASILKDALTEETDKSEESDTPSKKVAAEL